MFLKKIYMSLRYLGKRRGTTRMKSIKRKSQWKRSF